MKKAISIIFVSFLLFLTSFVSAQGIGSIDDECAVFGYENGIAKWEWDDGWAPEGDSNGTLVNGTDTVATFDAGREGLVAIVVKAGHTEHYILENSSGTVEQDSPAISHITFCENTSETPPVPFCGDGIVNQESEECDGEDGLIDNYICTKECLLEYVPYCGDGEVNQESEKCDDGNEINNDACSNSCTTNEPYFPNSTCLIAYTVDGEFEDQIPDDLSRTGEIDIQDILDDEYGFLNKFKDQLQVQKWTCADETLELQVRYIGEWAGYNQIFGYYIDSDPNTFEPLFRSGPVHLDDNYLDLASYNDTYTVTITDFDFLSFAIDSWTGAKYTFWSTENDVNGGIDNVVAYNPYPDTYLLGFEDLTIDRLIDFNDLDLEVKGTCLICGDGVVNQESEECDGEDGVIEGYTCSDNCTLELLPFCGDGVVNQETEECDGTDGLIEHYICTEECLLEYVPYCGDGIVNQESEECDGSAPPGQSCSDTCELTDLTCLDINYHNPYYANQTAQWINTESRVELIIDSNASDCINATHKYNILSVESSYCVDSCTDWSPIGESGEEYEGLFGLDEESCYIIEYYTSFDEHNSSVRWDCVFHDKTSPKINKTVGEPNSEMSQEDKVLGSIFYPDLISGFCDFPGNCLQVSLDTTIDFSCEDILPDPSGVKEMCYKVGFDGDDATESYCDGTMKDGLCCLEATEHSLTFKEESWHNLNITCIDNVNKSSSHFEYFKVDGRAFNITLGFKWSLISIPLMLYNDSPEAVFTHPNIDSVWSYRNESWYVWSPNKPSNLEHIRPGYGYWVLTTNTTEIQIFGSPRVFGHHINTYSGWNLLGYYGLEGCNHYPGCVGKSASCALTTLQGFSSVYSYDQASWNEYSLQDHLSPGAGYWVYAYENASYGPTTTC